MPRWVLALSIVASVVAGCSKSDTVDVTGTVTMSGKPAENVQVTFNPKGAARMATGVTDANGRFALSTAKPNDGAMPGEYVVTLGEYYPPGKPPPLPPRGGLLPSRFPPKYGDPGQSPLTATVAPEGKNDFPFDVK